MIDSEKKFTEDEFLNILDEPETSSPNEIILGACSCDGNDFCLDLVCITDQCINDYCCDCTSFTLPCPNNTVCLDSHGSYYYIAFSNILSYGYYNSNEYSITGARGAFENAISTNTLTNSAVLYSIKNSLSNNGALVTDNHKKFIWTSGMSSYNIYPTGTTPCALVGYVYLKFYSAATHYTRTTVPIAVYGFTTTSYTAFTGLMRNVQIATAWGFQNVYFPEKTFYLNVIYGGNANTQTINLQGAEITLSNVSYQAFPHLLTENGNYCKPKTGLAGLVVLCTSSLTTTDNITGVVSRHGLEGNLTKAFMARTQQVTLIRMLSTRPETEAETVVTTNAPRYINPAFRHTIPNLNLTKNLLSQCGYTYCGITINNNNQVITFDKTFQIRPGFEYLYHDPLLGKIAQAHYSVQNNIGLTYSEQTAATLNWNTKKQYEITLPSITNTGNTYVSVDINYITTINGNTYNNVLYFGVLNAGQSCIGESVVISYKTILGSSQPIITLPDINYTLYLRAKISAGNNNQAILYAGNYYYTISDASEPGGNNF